MEKQITSSIIGNKVLLIRANIDGDDLGWHEVPLEIISDMLFEKTNLDIDQVCFTHTHETSIMINFVFLSDNRLYLENINKKNFINFIK